MTPVDSLYEYAGFKLAGILQDTFAAVGLPIIVGLAGVAYLVWALPDRVSVRDLGSHLIYLAIAAWLLGPAKRQDVSAPRLALYLDEAADLLQRRTILRLQERFLEDPFEWERVAGMVSFAQIMDPDLNGEVREFLEGCAKPALAREAPRGANVFRAGVLTYVASCESRRERLWRRLREHVREDPYHRSVLAAVRRREPGGEGAFIERYLDELARRAVDDPQGPTGEAALVASSLGEYSILDPAQSTGGLPLWAKVAGSVHTPWAAPLLFLFGDRLADTAFSAAAAVKQGWDNRFTANQKYYLATVYGPHVYGLSLMLVLGLFPVVGLFSLMPGKWRAWVNYGKVFISIKLWPVGWAALSTFNARRSALEAFEPGGRGTGDVFLAVASMYLVVPVLAFMVVHLATAAAAAPFSQAVPPPSGAGVSPMALAARSAR